MLFDSAEGGKSLVAHGTRDKDWMLAGKPNYITKVLIKK